MDMPALKGKVQNIRNLFLKKPNKGSSDYIPEPADVFRSVDSPLLLKPTPRSTGPPLSPKPVLRTGQPPVRPRLGSPGSTPPSAPPSPPTPDKRSWKPTSPTNPKLPPPTLGSPNPELSLPTAPPSPIMGPPGPDPRARTHPPSPPPDLISAGDTPIQNLSKTPPEVGSAASIPPDKEFAGTLSTMYPAPPSSDMGYPGPSQADMRTAENTSPLNPSPTPLDMDSPEENSRGTSLNLSTQPPVMGSPGVTTALPITQSPMNLLSPGSILPPSASPPPDDLLVPPHAPSPTSSVPGYLVINHSAPTPLPDVLASPKPKRPAPPPPTVLGSPRPSRLAPPSPDILASTRPTRPAPPAWTAHKSTRVPSPFPRQPLKVAPPVLGLEGKSPPASHSKPLKGPPKPKRANPPLPILSETEVCTATPPTLSKSPGPTVTQTPPHVLRSPGPMADEQLIPSSTVVEPIVWPTCTQALAPVSGSQENTSLPPAPVVTSDIQQTPTTPTYPAALGSPGATAFHTQPSVLNSPSSVDNLTHPILDSPWSTTAKTPPPPSCAAESRTPIRSAAPSPEKAPQRPVLASAAITEIPSTPASPPPILKSPGPTRPAPPPPLAPSVRAPKPTRPPPNLREEGAKRKIPPTTSTHAATLEPPVLGSPRPTRQASLTPAPVMVPSPQRSARAARVPPPRPPPCVLNNSCQNEKSTPKPEPASVSESVTSDSSLTTETGAPVGRDLSASDAVPGHNAFQEDAPSLGKLQRQVKCPYWMLCAKILDSLKIPDVYFDTQYDVCYCDSCFYSRGDQMYYTSGEPPKTFGLPLHWSRFGLRTSPQTEVSNKLKTWHLAYHSTTAENLESIIHSGDILGDVTFNGEPNMEVSRHTSGDIKQVVVSPTIKYASNPAYSKVYSWTDPDPGKTHNARFVLQLMIDPDSYIVERETGALGKERIDVKFKNEELKCSVKVKGSTFLIGILIRLDI